MPKVISATANPDKLREISAIFKSLWGEPVEIIARPRELPETIEDGETLEENARLKAKDVFDSISGGELDTLDEPTFIIADDTGLSVDALNGAPGVRSARFAGENATYADNVAKLLAELGDEVNRAAHFSTVIVALFLDGLELVTGGSIEGKILTEPRGNGGFGYDCIFEPTEGGGKTFAEMTAAEKDNLSHRARAINSLREILEQFKD